MSMLDVTQSIRAQNGLEAVAQCLLAGAPHSCRRAAHSVTRSRIICPTLQEVRHLANQPERWYRRQSVRRFLVPNETGGSHTAEYQHDNTPHSCDRTPPISYSGDIQTLSICTTLVTKSEYSRKQYKLNDYFLATKSANLCLLSNMQGMKNVEFVIINSYLKGKIFMHFYGEKEYCRWCIQTTKSAPIKNGDCEENKDSNWTVSILHSQISLHTRCACGSPEILRGTASVGIQLYQSARQQADGLDDPGFDL